MTASVHLATEADTLALGRWLGERLQAGAVVGLDGPLGSGKTWMAKGIVRGLGGGCEVLVKSPAYNLIHEYPLRGRVRTAFHLDFYRLPSLGPRDAPLFEEVLGRPDAVYIVEWASRFLADLVPDFLSVTLSVGPRGAGRHASFAVVGENAAYAKLVGEIARHAVTHH